MGEPTPPAPLVYGPLTRTDFVRYQGASGDMNPMHHDDPMAQKAKFPSVFSPGMFQAGLLATWATDWLGPENIRRYWVRFREQVWPDDVLTCSGEVVKTYEVNGERRVDLKLTCTRQTGGEAIAGEATFVLP
jgi:acyl dehydratase